MVRDCFTWNSFRPQLQSCRLELATARPGTKEWGSCIVFLAGLFSRVRGIKEPNPKVGDTMFHCVDFLLHWNNIVNNGIEHFLSFLVVVVLNEGPVYYIYSQPETERTLLLDQKRSTGQSDEEEKRRQKEIFEIRMKQKSLQFCFLFIRRIRIGDGVLFRDRFLPTALVYILAKRKCRWW